MLFNKTKYLKAINFISTIVLLKMSMLSDDNNITLQSFNDSGKN